MLTAIMHTPPASCVRVHRCFTGEENQDRDYRDTISPATLTRITNLIQTMGEFGRIDLCRKAKISDSLCYKIVSILQDDGLLIESENSKPRDKRWISTAEPIK